MMKAMYFHEASWKESESSRALPKQIMLAPVRTSGMSLPQRDMTIPAMMEPIGVASEGRARRAPAFVADSIKITWKKSGIMKRNY
jgi:hypothetical protein